MNVPDIIKHYSDKNIFIEVLADGYKLEEVGICWRGYVNWFEDGEWRSDDIGCRMDWEDAFEDCVEMIENYVLKLEKLNE